MSSFGALVAFVVSLLVGGLGVYVAARVVVGSRSYEHAVVTALIGAFVWGAVTFLLPSFGFGSLVPLLAWITVIKWRYPASWLEAGAIGLLAWLVAVVVIEVLPVSGLDAVGVTFV